MHRQWSTRLGWASGTSIMTAPLHLSQRASGKDLAAILRESEAAPSGYPQESTRLMKLPPLVHVQQTSKGRSMMAWQSQRIVVVVLGFAGTTPILDDRHARRGANFDRF